MGVSRVLPTVNHVKMKIFSFFIVKVYASSHRSDNEVVTRFLFNGGKGILRVTLGVSLLRVLIQYYWEKHIQGDVLNCKDVSALPIATAVVREATAA